MACDSRLRALPPPRMAGLRAGRRNADTSACRHDERVFKEAWVAELVDARDLKSLGGPPPCRFKSGPRHQ